MSKEIILPKVLQEKLLKLPESGMGYQIVDLVVFGGEILYDVVVLNGKIAIVTNEVNEGEIIDIKMNDYGDMKPI